MSKTIEDEAAAKVEALLALPPVPDDGVYADDECFTPWSLFPSLYGTYGSDFDEMALTILQELLHDLEPRRDLASEMFREMLCTAGLCRYGSSPRVCFPSQPFKRLLPELIERWRQYARIQWRGNITFAAPV